ncbi:MAG: ABC-F family ATP-binding cassette domain-containing protein [Tepidisphaeraceae bacterium]|jgi:ATP-binding cassette subfamily F protein uup
MAFLFRCDSVSKWLGSRQLFNGLSISFDDGERTGLIGPNGSGKSTLLRILTGLETPDSGSLSMRRNLKLGYVPQEDTFSKEATVRSAMLDGWDDAHVEEHDRASQATILLTQIGFEDFDQLASTLSGGWRKRLAIARQIVRRPDVLLMDEPTNHLDLEGILWLEKVLGNAPFAFLLVSHDRYFLENVTNRTVELNGAYADGYLSVASHYSDFLTRKQEYLAAQASLEQSVASRVRREIEWLHRGAKARTTKAKGRIQEAHRAMDQLADLQQRNSLAKTAELDFVSSGRQTRKLIDVKAIAKSLGGRMLFKDVTFTLAPQTKLGLLGPNGVGKTTLIKLLAGELEPDAGAIRRADQLKTIVFDQAREQLDQKITLKQALSPGGETVVFRGQPMHVAGWARRFLFRTEQLDMPVGELSGGEQARILIAGIMLKPADVLILDEPTNDLDIDSLEVLEESLSDFPGALVLVTHDRYLLDRLATQLLGLDGQGGARLLTGVEQYERMIGEKKKPSAEKIAAKTAQFSSTPAPGAKPKKLSYKEQREWDQMGSAITVAEADLQAKQAMLDDPKILADHVKLAEASHQAAAAQATVEALYRRWSELESIRGG